MIEITFYVNNSLYSVVLTYLVLSITIRFIKLVRG
jgi:hypothetical protein